MLPDALVEEGDDVATILFFSIEILLDLPLRRRRMASAGIKLAFLGPPGGYQLAPAFGVLGGEGITIVEGDPRWWKGTWKATCSLVLSPIGFISVC